MDTARDVTAGSLGAAEFVAELEALVERHAHAKGGVPDCPCWANAPQRVDDALRAALAARAGEDAGSRFRRLVEAVERHREEMELTPECTCWINNGRGDDQAMYRATRVLADRWALTIGSVVDSAPRNL